MIKCEGWCLFVMCNISPLYQWFLFVWYLYFIWHFTSSSMFILVLYIMLILYVWSKIKCNIAVPNRLWAWIILLSNHTVFFHVGKVTFLRHSNYTVKFQRKILYQKIKNCNSIKNQTLSMTMTYCNLVFKGFCPNFVGVGLRGRVKG